MSFKRSNFISFEKAFFVDKRREIKTQINTLYPQYSQQQTKKRRKTYTTNKKVLKIKEKKKKNCSYYNYLPIK